jgi:hypothetical protein
MLRQGANADERSYVAGWHVTTLCRLGFTLLKHESREYSRDATRFAPVVQDLVDE